jgi:hypothetical protein
MSDRHNSTNPVTTPSDDNNTGFYGSEDVNSDTDMDAEHELESDSENRNASTTRPTYVPTRQLASTSWDQLLAETEPAEHKQNETEAEEPMPLQIRVRERCDRTWVDLDGAAGSRGAKAVQSDRIIHHSTTSTKTTDILKDYLFEVQYMVC